MSYRYMQKVWWIFEHCFRVRHFSMTCGILWQIIVWIPFVQNIPTSPNDNLACNTPCEKKPMTVSAQFQSIWSNPGIGLLPLTASTTGVWVFSATLHLYFTYMLVDECELWYTFNLIVNHLRYQGDNRPPQKPGQNLHLIKFRLGTKELIWQVLLQLTICSTGNNN